MVQQLRTFTEAFLHLLNNLWYEAAHHGELRIDWLAVTGTRSSTELPELLRRVLVPVSLGIVMVQPERDLERYNADWPTDAKHSKRKWHRFFKRNAAASRTTGELFTYKYTGTPSIHGFSLNDRYFYISYTAWHGSESVVVPQAGYSFFRSGQDCDDEIAAFRSAYRERQQIPLWPLGRNPDFGEWLKIPVNRALKGDSEDYEELLKPIIGFWVMKALREGKSSDKVFAEAEVTRQALLKDPSLALAWLMGEKLPTATEVLAPELVDELGLPSGDQLAIPHGASAADSSSPAVCQDSNCPAEVSELDSIPTSQAKSGPPVADIDWEVYAIGLLTTGMSIAEIAEVVGVHRSTMYSWARFIEAAEKAGKYNPRKSKAREARVPKGQKDKRSQNIEAEDYREKPPDNFLNG